MKPNDQLSVTPLDARRYQMSNEKQRQDMVAEWLDRAVNAQVSEADNDIPPNERDLH
jgi:hypothetical protein